MIQKDVDVRRNLWVPLDITYSTISFSNEEFKEKSKLNNISHVWADNRKNIAHKHCFSYVVVIETVNSAQYNPLSVLLVYWNLLGSGKSILHNFVLFDLFKFRLNIYIIIISKGKPIYMDNDLTD